MKKSDKGRREIPADNRLAWRAGYLSALRWVEPRDKEAATLRGLSPGNTKTGTSGSLYKTVFVWNLPAVASCPGASQWCLSHCYNADERFEVFPVDQWSVDWAQVEKQPSALMERIIRQLSAAAEPVAVRIHSSGDFYSSRYISFW